MNRTLAVAMLACLAAASSARAQTASTDKMTVDGRFDEAIWSRAQVIDDFKVTQPYSLATPRHPTRAMIVGTPEGIAIGFRVTHPAQEPRQRERTARDVDPPGDRINVYLDFNADGVVAYDFCVALSGSVQDATLVNENNYSPDWDGEWFSAVHEEADSWNVEILIPWTIARMRDTSTPRRTVAVLFDRVFGATSERSAWPAESFERARYVSNFARVEIDQYATTSLDVFPYVSALTDNIDGDHEFKAGLDLFWKPSGDFQLAAALNPDFGQVEADELVVNFDAIETFLSDRRPFFTENQGFFDLRTPNTGLLIYTRRIGGPNDVDGGVADIDAAVKVIGAQGNFDYGVLAALESDHADDLGRAFYAQRVTYGFDRFTIGYLGTFVDRPALDRTAMVNAFDFQWRPNDTVQLVGQVLGTQIDVSDTSRNDTGEWFRLDLTPSAAWAHQLEVTHFGRDLDFNDLGYLPQASYNELEWQSSYTDSDFGAESPFRSMTWSFEPQIRYNDGGDRLANVLILEHISNLRQGTSVTLTSAYRFSGTQDTILRGNGDVRLAPRPEYVIGVVTPRMGRWNFELESRTYKEGLHDWAYSLSLEGTYAASDTLSIGASFEPTWSRDWLIWERENLLGRYQREAIGAGININWLPAPAHELRAKLEWLAIDADNPRAYRVGPDDVMRESNDIIDPFGVQNFGLQLRYRWTFRPQSDLYVVYSRGGLAFQSPQDEGASDLFFDATNLRDADQFLVKVRYRF